MNPRNNTLLEKSREVKEYGISRIDQLKKEMEERNEGHKLIEEELPDDGFIDNDVDAFDEDEQADTRKKINTNPRSRIHVTKTSKQQEATINPEQRQKLEERSKAVLENLIKEKMPDSSKEEAIRIQNQFKSSAYARQFSDRPKYPQVPNKESLTDRLLYNNFALKVASSDFQKETHLDFFLLDAVEDVDNTSIVYLFGKVLSKKQYINACIQVSNIQREVYIMPRIGFSVQEIEQEVKDTISSLKNFGKADLIFTKITKKYCFELDVDFRNEDVEVLKISYSYKAPSLGALGQIGRTYKGVFGVGTNALEHLTIVGKLQGPSWLRVENFEIVAQSTFSDQQLNVKVADFKNSLKTSDYQPPAPPLTLLSFQICLNSDTQDIEATYISLYSEFKIEENTFSTVDHILLHNRTFPLKAEPQSDKSRMYLNSLQDTEYTHLSTLQSLFTKLNPDIIVGHELFSGVLDVYLTKLSKNGIDSLNLLSRVCIDPKRLRSVAMKNLKNKMKLVFAGRLLLDTYALSKEFLKLDEYSLSAIHASLNKDNLSLLSQTPEIELRTAAEQIKDILIKLQLLPLTLQLSKVAGCLWQTSLRQARAERNEVLLLHKFHSNNYILPDRFRFEKEEDDSEEKGFSGGLVLDPKSGFYDDYIVLVDFNSLYPSIIRHYKICFTTVIRQYRNLEKVGKGQQEAMAIEAEITDEKELIKPVNEISLHGDQEPLLPQILTMLIGKRKEVKNLMKREKNPSVLRQLDIKQQAYKLIANSIYGCLGFSFSRFYSKKMAALVTHFGRILLKNSEELINSKGYSVIYGDTDSLMVNTMKNDLAEAIMTGIELKQEINNQFKKDRNSRDQILEVELDGVYKKMLLLKKKKYAGIAVTNYMQIAQSSNDDIKEQTKLEIKGMDMIRRDWSKLTKDVCYVVLNIIMASGDLEEVYLYLTGVNQSLNAILKIENPNDYQSSAFTEPVSKGDNTIDNNIKVSGLEEEELPVKLPVIEIRDFVIKRQLNKKPSEYGDTSGQPHVRVAIWMRNYFNKTDEQLLNHFIPYVITTRGSALGDKAMHIEEYYNQFNNPVINGNANAGQEEQKIHHIDVAWYKNSQILNPVHRMLEVIEGHSEERLKLIFELRGGCENQPEEIEDRKYTLFESIGRVQAEMPFIYRAQNIDLEEFKVRCPLCQDKCYSFLSSCPVKVNSKYDSNVFKNRVTSNISSVMLNFYNFTKKCNECSFTSNQFSVAGSSCVHHEGKRMKQITTPKDIAEKICYFRDLCIKLSENKTIEGDVFSPIIKEIAYESKHTLKAFGYYSNGNKGQDRPDHVMRLV
jgi:DNA polymerase alpha subunit A